MLKLKPLISAKAKENLVTHTKNGYKQLCQNSDNPVDTKKELSKLAGVSHDTISRIEKIADKAPVRTFYNLNYPGKKPYLKRPASGIISKLHLVVSSEENKKASRIPQRLSRRKK